jgi:hypothetical protein
MHALEEEKRKVNKEKKIKKQQKEDRNQSAKVKQKLDPIIESGAEG